MAKRFTILLVSAILGAPGLYAQTELSGNTSGANNESNAINQRFEQLRAINTFRDDYLAEARSTLFLAIPYQARPYAKDSRQLINARELVQLPPKARSDFDKGNQALRKGDYEKARTRFQAALSEFDFSLGHQNLGVAALYLKDVETARREFQKAAQLDPQMAIAFQNLGVLEVQQQNFAAAETPLAAANRLEPTNMKTLTLLAFAQAMNRHYDDAIASAGRVHALPKHEAYAFAHMVAATALESSGHVSEAIDQYKQFIAEDPQNPRVPIAKQAMQRLQTSSKQGQDRR